MERLRWLEIVADDEANALSQQVVSSSESAVTAEVIPTDEEQVISAHVARLLEA